MATVEITVQPTGEETHHETSVVLDGARYFFAFYTNAADNGWNFDLENDDGTSVARGLALSVGANLLFPYRHLSFPPGRLWVLDKNLVGDDPSIDSFKNATHALLYTDAEDS